MRFEEENNQSVRTDSLLNNLSKNAINQEELVDIQISLYCLTILVKTDLEKLKQNEQNFEKTMSNIKEKQNKFIQLLSEDLTHKPITPKTYKTFLRSLISELKLNNVLEQDEHAVSENTQQFFQNLVEDVTMTHKKGGCKIPTIY